MTPTTQTGPTWRLAALIVLAAVALVGWRWLMPEQAADGSHGAAQGTVSVAFDLGDGSPQRDYTTDWQPGLTAFEALADVRREHPEVTYSATGTGQDAFVSELMGLAGGDVPGHYWLFEVNGKKSDLGSGVAELEPGDSVLWRFADQE